MDEHGSAPALMGRRRVLRDLGLAAIGGATLASTVDREAAMAAITPVTAINVKDAPYSAKGDGATDDKAAIQAALNDVPTAGGSVYFPPGDYVVSGPLAPKSRTFMYGGHVARWEGGTNPASSTKIRVRTGFTGAGLIVPAATTVAVGIRDLALVGAGVGTGIHGIRMPDAAGAAGNSSFAFKDLSISGFTGSGIYGQVQVAIVDNCYIDDNSRWGIEASSGNAWLDAHLSNCYFHYNRLGHVYFGGAGVSGAVEFVNCRFDRAGANPAVVGTPYTPSAPGVRIASARFISFVNCSTDANCGNGFEVVHEADTPSNYPHDIQLTGCRFNRDGTGNQSTLDAYAGLKVRGSGSGSAMVTNVKAVNCITAYGKADDSGAGTIIGPKYGVWYENANYFQWIGGASVPSPSVTDNEYYVGSGGNWRTAIYDVEQGLFSLPLSQPSAGLPVPDGSAYFDASTNRINVRNGATWKSVLLT